MQAQEQCKRKSDAMALQGRRCRCYRSSPGSLPHFRCNLRTPSRILTAGDSAAALLGRVDMKLKVKRSTGGTAGVLDTPAETYAPEPLDTTDYPYPGPRQPAPAGSLHRGYKAGNFAEDGNLTADSPFRDEQEYVPRRGRSAMQQRLRRMPGSVAGRVVLGLLLLVLVGLLAVGAAAVRSFVFQDARFRLASGDDIQVTGGTHLTHEQVRAVFAGDLERSIFHISLGERRSDVERLPWVQHATVMRLLPHTVRVAVTERTPVAFARQGTQLGLVDGSGVLLDMPAADAGDPQYSFPVLTGVTAAQTPAERASRVDLYRRFISDLPPAAADGLSEVDVTDPEDVKAVIPSGGGDVLVHFGEDNFDRRYADFEAHLAEWRQQYPRLDSADMRYEGQVVLEMKQGTAGSVDASVGSVTAPVNVSSGSAANGGVASGTAANTTAAPVAATPAAAPAPIRAATPVPRPLTTPATQTPAAASARATAAAAAPLLPTPGRQLAKPAARTVSEAVSAPTAPKARPVARAAAKPDLQPAGRARPRTPPSASGRSASNERMFAALAAQRKAAEARSRLTAGGAR